MSLVYWFLKKESINSSLSMFVYLTISIFFLESLSTIRFHLALSIILLSTHYLNKKKYVKFLILYILAINCHKAALIGIIFPFLFLYSPNRFWNIIMVVCSYFLPTVILHYLSNFNSGAAWYIERAGETAGFTLMPILLILFDIINLVFFKRLVALDKNMKRYIYIYNFGCSIMLLFSFEATLATRLSRFFTIYILLIIPYYLFLFRYKKIVKQCLYLCLISIFFVTLFVSSKAFYSKKAEKDQFLPYKTFITK